MSLYQTNLSFLTKNYPALIPVLETVSDSIYECTSYLTRHNEPNLLFENKGRSYSLHSRYNAQYEARTWAESIRGEVTGHKHILIIGIGLGYFLEEVLSITDAKDIYIYEPSPQVFKEWVNTRRVSDSLSDPRIRAFAVGTNEILALQLAEEIASHLSGSFAFFSPPIYRSLYPELIDLVGQKMKDRIIQQISNMQTLDHYQETWLANILYNLPHILLHPTISDLNDLWKGQNVKAIIVGSGPSLQKDIHYLKNLKSNCLIIAAGSSIQSMEHFGVYPHFVVSMDGSESNYEVFKNIDTSKVPLVFCPPVYYKITDYYEGEVYHCRFEDDSIIKHIADNDNLIPQFISTSTVTGTAMQIAAYMGITEIILMGQDLSYPDEQYYAPGVNHVTDEFKENALKHSKLWVPNVEGGFNRTKGSMQVLLNDIEVLVQIMKLRGVSIINTSKKGAVIKGTEWISMDELYPALHNSTERDFDISSYISSSDSNTMRLTKVIETSRKLDLILQSIVKMDLRLNQLIKYIERIEQEAKSKDVNKVNKTLREINKHWKWITKQELFQVFYDYSLKHAISIYMRYVPEIAETQDPIEKGKLISEHLKKLIEKFIKFNPDLQKTIKKAKEKLELAGQKYK